MNTVFLDTETTGFNPENVVQLSYVIVDGQKEAANGVRTTWS